MARFSDYNKNNIPRQKAGLFIETKKVELKKMLIGKGTIFVRELPLSFVLGNMYFFCNFHDPESKIEVISNFVFDLQRSSQVHLPDPG